MRLVPDWKRSWRWFSVQLLTLSATLQIAFMAMPPELKVFLPEHVTHSLAIGVLAAAILGRLIDQPEPAKQPATAVAVQVNPVVPVQVNPAVPKPAKIGPGDPRGFRHKRMG